MRSGHTPHLHDHDPKDVAVAMGAGLATWRTFAVDLPLRLAAETMRFTGRRLQAQADHLVELARCGSLNEAVELQTAFVTKGLTDYRQEATTLSRDVTESAFAKAA